MNFLGNKERFYIIGVSLKGTKQTMLIVKW